MTPPTQFQTVQGAIQADIPGVRIHASQVEEVKAGEVSLDENDCFLVSDPTEDFYGDLAALFCESVDEEVMLPHVDSVDTVKPFEHTIVSGKITHRPDTNIRATAFSKLLGKPGP